MSTWQVSAPRGQALLFWRDPARRRVPQAAACSEGLSWTDVHANTHADADANTHANTHANANTHTNTYTYTDTCNLHDLGFGL